MAEKKPSLDWLDDIAAITAQREKTPSGSHADWANSLKLNRGYVSQLLALQPIFDPPTVEKIRQAAPSFVFSYSRVKELSRLKGKVEDFPNAGREVVEKTLAGHLTSVQIKDLVDKIIGVKPQKGSTDSIAQGTFERLGKRIDGWFGGSSTQPEEIGEEAGSVMEPAHPSHGPRHVASAQGAENNEPKEAETPKAATKTKPVKLWEVPFKIVGWLFKWFLLKPGKWLETKILKRVNAFLDHPGTFMKNLVVGTVQFIFWVVILCVLVWALRWGWDHYGRSYLSGYLPWPFKGQTQVSQTVPPAQAENKPRVKKHSGSGHRGSTQNTKPNTQNSLNPFTSYNPAMGSEVDSVQSEMESIPPNTEFFDFKMAPDSSMGADMATARLQDLQDTEKYSLKMGKDTKKIESIQIGPTGLTLALSGGLAGNFLGGGAKIAFYWEGVKALHAYKAVSLDENSQDHTLYQLGRMASGLKKPLVIQCADPDEMERLVSAVEYWVRSARKGQNTPITGLPYLNQGMVLGEKNAVLTLWANSPACRADLRLEDEVWSLDRAAADQQSQSELEEGLNNLTTGPHDLYLINPEQRNKDRDNSGSLTLLKLVLNVP